MAFRVAVQDWNVARKYGCKLSYADFKKMHAEQHGNVSIVVMAWCNYFVRNNK